jgi:hypothetical protein
MTAEPLRRAAALMRQRAEAVKAAAAEPDQWFGVDELTDALTEGGQAEMGDPHADAEHIASLTPDVALAMAHLLERDADLMEQTAFADIDWERSNSMNVARKYLGEAS